MGRAVTHFYNTSTQEVEAEGSEGQTHPWIHSESEANLGYPRLCLKIIVIVIIIIK